MHFQYPEVTQKCSADILLHCSKINNSHYHILLIFLFIDDKSSNKQKKGDNSCLWNEWDSLSGNGSEPELWYISKRVWEEVGRVG